MLGKFGRKKYSYLQHDGRLGDVICLVQYLALKDRKGTFDGSIRDVYVGKVELERFFGAPVSANCWLELAKEHGELFRHFSPKTPRQQHENISLSARFAMPVTPCSDKCKESESLCNECYTEKLSDNLVIQLSNLAMQMHEKQKADRQIWIPVGTLIASSATFIMALIAMISLLFLGT